MVRVGRREGVHVFFLQLKNADLVLPDTMLQVINRARFSPMFWNVLQPPPHHILLAADALVQSDVTSSSLQQTFLTASESVVLPLPGWPCGSADALPGGGQG